MNCVTVHGYVDRPELWPLQRTPKLGALLVVQASSLPSRPFVNVTELQKDR